MKYILIFLKLCKQKVEMWNIKTKNPVNTVVN